MVTGKEDANALTSVATISPTPPHSRLPVEWKAVKYVTELRDGETLFRIKKRGVIRTAVNNRKKFDFTDTIKKQSVNNVRMLKIERLAGPDRWGRSVL